MKKNILSVVLLSGLVLSVSATKSLAAEQADGSSQETSKVEVKLTEDKGHDVGTGPFKDKLAIVHKPTMFKFEGNATTGSLKLANKHQYADKQFISVNDDRKSADDDTTLVSSDWALTGKLDGLKAGSTPLTANMVFTPGELKQYNIGDLEDKNGVYDYAPAPINPDADKVTDAKYNLSKNFTLPADDTEVQFLTSSGTDVTDPTGVFTNLGNVELLVATGNAQTAGDYTGTITWTLMAK